jgi:Mrp family chromosome partitioning ATPase
VSVFLAALVLLIVLPRECGPAGEAARQFAPPIAVLSASLVLGLMIGFGVTIGAEVRRPCVATAGEAARIAGTRALAVIAPWVPRPNRRRRDADRVASPRIDIDPPAYRFLHLDLATAAAGAGRLPMAVVTGDEPDIVGTVAANIAIAAAHDARDTLLIDTDRRHGIAAATIGVTHAPGVDEVLGGRVTWAETIVGTVVGRQHLLDVIPPGGPALRSTPSMERTAFGHARDELVRLARRYDAVIVSAPAGAEELAAASVLPRVDAVLCVRVAYTTLARLADAVRDLREAGWPVHGLVLWDDAA